MTPSVVVTLFLVGITSPRPEGAPPPSPRPSATADHRARVDQRHDEATGVGHADSVHHFDLGPRGGAIRLEVTSDGDTEGRDRIRSHLAMIAREFAQGRFDLPMLIHDQAPPGVETMKRLKSAIRYRYAPTARGGRVDISTEDTEARAAIHEFLRFQIDEHRTGDPREAPVR